MLLAAGLVFGGALFSQVQNNNSGRGTTGSDREKTPVNYGAAKMYNNQQMLREAGIDERAQILVGNVVFHHNGAVISCDSAVRYYEINRVDCYKNVIINKDSTFVYGESAVYNGDLNLAQVFSPVVKIVDGDAVLYTTDRFSFNTLDNIGTWRGGGVVYHEDNVMEAERGYYFSDLHEMVGVRGVQMKNDTHQIISDSVRYNTETKVATFYTRTYIWTDKGEMISALNGRYDSRDSLYFFWDNAYLLDEFRETWADTIDFRARVQDAILYGNVQIDDNEHSSSAFGDLAHYWGERGETRLTRRPALLNYDADQGNADTLYMRADTIFMFVRYPSDGRRRDSLDGAAAGGEEDRFAHLKWVDSLPDSVRLAMADSLAPVIAGLHEQIASLHRRADSIMTVLYPPPPEPEVPAPASDPLHVADTLPVLEVPPVGDTLPVVETRPVADSLTATTAPQPETVPEPESQPEPEPEKTVPPEVVEMRLRAEELAAEADSLSTAEGYIRPRPVHVPVSNAADSLARLRLDSTKRADSLLRMDSLRITDPKAYRILQKAETKRLKAEKTRLAAERREAKFAAKAATRVEKQRLRAEKRAAKAATKAAEIARRRRLARRGNDGALLDSLARADSLAPAVRDSLLRSDSLSRLDPLARLDSLPPSDSASADTTFRIFRGWYDVRIWRKDMQAVADSMVGFSVDSTIHMYRDPILWHADSQITSDSMVIYTAGQQIERAEFFGNPVMGNQIGGDGSRQFNQVKGRRMESLFKDGEIYRHNTYENAQAYYYMQEEEMQPDGSTVMSEALAFLVATAARISFLFEADSLRDIRMYEGVDYNVFPMDQIPGTQPTQMQGFTWRINRKPALSDVFDRRVRSSERTFHEGLARPEFPIAARIGRRREYLISNRMWADRSDPLPAYAIEFRRKYYHPEE